MLKLGRLAPPPLSKAVMTPGPLAGKGKERRPLTDHSFGAREGGLILCLCPTPLLSPLGGGEEGGVAPAYGSEGARGI